MVIGHVRCRYPSVSRVWRIASPNRSVVEGSPSISRFHVDCLSAVCVCITDLFAPCFISKINESLCFICLDIFFEIKFWIALTKFGEGPPLSLCGVAVKAEPVVENQHRSFLEEFFGEVEGAGRR